LVASGGNFAAVLGNRVWTWNHTTRLWTESPLLNTFSPSNVVGSDGNFSAWVSNRVYAWNQQDSSWSQSDQIGGLAGAVGSSLPLCEPGACDDANRCTDDFCNPDLGCVNPPIPACTQVPPQVPSGSGWGAALLVGALLAAGGRALRGRGPR
jgi:hypothetical protein